MKLQVLKAHHTIVWTKQPNIGLTQTGGLSQDQIKQDLFLDGLDIRTDNRKFWQEPEIGKKQKWAEVAKKDTIGSIT